MQGVLVAERDWRAFQLALTDNLLVYFVLGPLAFTSGGPTLFQVVHQPVAGDPSLVADSACNLFWFDVIISLVI